MTLNMKSMWLLSIPAAFLFNCSGQDRAKADIKAVLDAQVAAWNEGSLEGYMGGYWKSDSLLFLSSKKKMQGWEMAFEGYQNSYPDRKAMGHLTFSDLRIRILSDDAAYVTGAWAIDREHLDLGGLFSLLLRKKDGKWKIVTDHSS